VEDRYVVSNLGYFAWEYGTIIGPITNYEKTFWQVDWLKWAAIKKDRRSKSSTTRINHMRHLILNIDINLWRSSFSHVIVLFVRALDRRLMVAEFGLRSVGMLYRCSTRCREHLLQERRRWTITKISGPLGRDIASARIFIGL